MKLRKRSVLIAGIVGALAISGGALAFWTQSGSGTGQATTGATSAITVNQNSSISGMYPGGAASALSGDFSNPNAHHVKIDSVTATVHTFSSQDDAAKPACTEADFAIGGTSGVNDVPAGNDVGSWSGLTVRLLDLGTNQDNCKNVTIDVDYLANAA